MGRKEVRSGPCRLHSGPHLDGDAGVVLLQVLQADLQVQLASPSDDVLPGLFDDALEGERCASAPGPCSLDTRLGTEGTFGERRLQAPLQLEDRAQAIRAHERQQMGPWSFFCWFSSLNSQKDPVNRQPVARPQSREELCWGRGV